MTYEFAKYPDGTLGVFSNIGKFVEKILDSITRNRHYTFWHSVYFLVTICQIYINLKLLMLP